MMESENKKKIKRNDYQYITEVIACTRRETISKR